jgi:hypothetical protein
MTSLLRKFEQTQFKAKDKVLILGDNTKCRSILNDFKDIKSFVVSTECNIVDSNFDYIFLHANAENQYCIDLLFDNYAKKCVDSLELFQEIYRKCDSHWLVLRMRNGTKDKILWY